MPTQLTADDARQSLTAHLAAKGIEIHLKFGPLIGWGQLQRLLQDRAFVRYPVEIVFDAAKLQPGEFAFPEPKGASPEEGFTMFVHPLFALEPDRVPMLVLYQLVAVNYGDFASADEAETFGAAALGLTRDEYYAALCEISDRLGGEPGPANAAGSALSHLHAGGCSGGCSHV